MDRERRNCGNCAWNDFIGRCWNFDSPMCADFTDDDYVCEVWERKGDNNDC